VDMSRVVTNIVLVDLTPPMVPAEALAAVLRGRGVLCLATGPRRLRLVTHLDVSRADCQRAGDIIVDSARKL
jgi:threonine aldolase